MRGGKQRVSAYNNYFVTIIQRGGWSLGRAGPAAEVDAAPKWQAAGVIRLSWETNNKVAVEIIVEIIVVRWGVVSSEGACRKQRDVSNGRVHACGLGGAVNLIKIRPTPCHFASVVQHARLCVCPCFATHITSLATSLRVLTNLFFLVGMFRTWQTFRLLL